jgi:hypothetical protein
MDNIDLKWVFMQTVVFSEGTKRSAGVKEKPQPNHHRANAINRMASTLKISGNSSMIF